MPEEQKAHLIDRLGTFYWSEYVAHNQPWVRKMPFKVWLQKHLIRLGAL